MKWALLGLLVPLSGSSVCFARKQRALLREFWPFLKAGKAWRTLPILAVLILVSALPAAGSAIPCLPFLHPIS